MMIYHDQMTDYEDYESDHLGNLQGMYNNAIQENVAYLYYTNLYRSLIG